jgi:hypothetical protein
MSDERKHCEEAARKFLGDNPAYGALRGAVAELIERERAAVLEERRLAIVAEAADLVRHADGSRMATEPHSAQVLRNKAAGMRLAANLLEKI